MTSISVHRGTFLRAKRTYGRPIPDRINVLRRFASDEPLVSALGLPVRAGEPAPVE